ncbi:MAG TPA: SDR family NAD(P)-dependent oxidoreductase [Solimonas sp.]|nr:SDR family NAD(P)-dependent oxidoreductase [Solimonas sp.]
MSIHGKTIVLTGASSGIGESAAKQLAYRGAFVCLVARRSDELARVQREIEAEGGRCSIHVADLSKPESVEDCAEQLLAQHARIDVLVNNAGRSIRRPIRESLDRMHDFERTMQLNYLGAVRLTLKLLPRFIEQGRGHVVNSSSMSVQLPIPLFSAYLASKCAMDSFGRSLAAEMGHKGIDVTTIYFPMVRTPMSSRTRIYEAMPMMSVDEAGGLIVKAVDKRPSRISAPLGTVGGLALAALPGPVTRFSQLLFRGMDKQLRRRVEDSQP